MNNQNDLILISMHSLKAFTSVLRVFFMWLSFRSAGSDGTESILPRFGAVTMLGGRQSGETFRSALPEPILNVDTLIVTFKFLPCLTAHENTLLLYYRRF